MYPSRYDVPNVINVIDVPKSLLKLLMLLMLLMYLMYNVINAPKSLLMYPSRYNGIACIMSPLHIAMTFLSAVGDWLEVCS